MGTLNYALSKRSRNRMADIDARLIENFGRGAE